MRRMDITRMNHHAIAKRHGFTDLDGKRASFGFVSREVADAKDIRCEQTIGPRMPVGWVSRIRGVVKNSDTDCLALQRTKVVYPG